MRILALTNFFPPYYIGGYELACGETMARLAARGHEVSVLTSDYGCPPYPVELSGIRVWRRLDSHMGRPRPTWRRGYLDIRRGIRAVREVRRAIRTAHPDVISVWNLGLVSPLVLSAASDSGIPVVIAVSDYWLIEYIDDDPWLVGWGLSPVNPWKRTAKRAARAVVDRLIARTRLDPGLIQAGHFFSGYLLERYRERGLAPPDSAIIYHGIDLDNFGAVAPTSGSFSRLLFVGRLAPEKGPDVAIRAMEVLTREYGRDELMLEIVGDPVSVAYLVQLEALTRELGLSGRVIFRGKVERGDLSSIYQSHDALLFPSIWPEPFSITLLEAMASGLPVISTATGGSGEILRDGSNCLVVDAGDPGAMAKAIDRLARDRSLRERLGVAARADTLERADIVQTVEAIEATLLRAASVGIAVN